MNNGALTNHVKILTLIIHCNLWRLIILALVISKWTFIKYLASEHIQLMACIPIRRDACLNDYGTKSQNICILRNSYCTQQWVALPQGYCETLEYSYIQRILWFNMCCLDTPKRTHEICTQRLPLASQCILLLWRSYSSIQICKVQTICDE